ncbi:hypothetical protein [Nocardia terpenica]|uniref:Uncharacterized protein n=1 Tax=Nocardia terpenica TaxID=455432 RepID=A0A164MFM6_9NOCA|nr:hypothetical protein [Nocardia terpenica]KZM73313.1 hypothetical protein AWN90_32140 [Nocardia terpenica]NQE87537.1 hypothetical protein [Nocardia terpenica]
MSRSKDDTAALARRASEVHAELLAAYGEDWPDHLWNDIRPDDDAVPVDLPPLESSDDVMVPFTAELRIPRAAYERLIARAEEAGLERDELLSEWITAEASADDTVSRDEILALLARRQPRTA